MSAPADAFPPWKQRPPIPASMLNPALLGVIVAVSANQYEHISGLAMPWPLAHLICPMVLHEPTRTDLPRTTATSLAAWVSDHPVLVAGLPARARHMTDHVREGLRFGLREQMFALENARLTCHRLPRTTARSAGDLHQIVLGAGMIGRVFGRLASPATIFATLRVQP